MQAFCQFRVMKLSPSQLRGGLPPGSYGRLTLSLFVSSSMLLVLLQKRTEWLARDTVDADMAAASRRAGSGNGCQSMIPQPARHVFLWPELNGLLAVVTFSLRNRRPGRILAGEIFRFSALHDVPDGGQMQRRPVSMEG